MPFKNVTYLINDKRHRIERPLKSRDIPLKATSERGFLPSLKKISIDDNVTRVTNHKLVTACPSISAAPPYVPYPATKPALPSLMR